MEMKNIWGRMSPKESWARKKFVPRIKKKPLWLEGSEQGQEWPQVIEVSRNSSCTTSEVIHAIPLSCGIIIEYKNLLSPWHHLPQHSWCFAVSDGSGKTATGTICIEVPDIHDYCPVIFAESKYICIASPSILISVYDHSYGAPFTFCVADQPPGTADLWDIRSINGKWNPNLLIKTKSKNNYQIIRQVMS